ncbi:MAG: hypothetical protein RLZZ303_1711 [Candidatus Hydrogenedentota bacterium]|jgi:ADP-ribose pyrophosphatase
MEQWVSPEVKFSGRIFTVRAGGITLDDGTPAYREVVEHPGGVCVLPFDGTHVTLVRQYRIAVGEEVLEAVAGKLEPGDDPAHRARLELEEEAGIRADTLVEAGTIFGCVGFCSERIFLFLALDLHYGIARPEAEEQIELVKLHLDEVKQLLDNHTIKDAKTIVLLERLLRRNEQC